MIVTDAAGRITFLNAEAESLTGWVEAEAAGQPLPEVFRIINERTRQRSENPVEKVLQAGKTVGLANHTILVAKGGQEKPIDDSAAPIRHGDGPTSGVVLVFRDVSEQRKAQKVTARLAAIVEHSGDAVIAKNLDGIIQTWNAGAERLFGYKAEEIIGKSVTQLFPPDRLTEEDHILDLLKQGNVCERFETVRLTKDGQRIPVSVVISPIKDEEGLVVGASRIVRDISEIVAAREALAKEKELLATTLASIGDGVIVTDKHGRVTFLNGESERLTGWKNAEASGRPLPEVFHIINEQTRQMVENPVEKVLRLGTVVGLANHTVLISKDGRKIPIDDSAAPIRQHDGRLFGVVLVFRDFTEQKRAEETLRAAHQQASSQARLLDLTDDAIFVRDQCDRITYWNKGAEEAYGYTREEALSKVAHELLRTEFPEPLQSITQKLYRDRHWSGDLVQTRRDGRRITVASRWTPDFDEHKRPVGVLAINNNITERKQIEEKLREAQRKLLVHAADLEERVAERTAKLQDMVNELEHVSYAITHDMRAPLRAMSTFAAFLLEENKGESATSQDYCRRIVVGANRLDGLIQGALHYTNAILQEMPMELVDLGKLVHGLIETYPNLQADKADIEVDGPLPTVLGNESLLTQCFSNLLGNAVKFVAPNVRPRVRLRAVTTGDATTIWFEDNGIGISRESQARLFKMFERLTSSHDGSGIGLAVVRKVAERMGGKVGVESDAGKGSRFWLQLQIPKTTLKR